MSEQLVMDQQSSQTPQVLERVQELEQKVASLCEKLEGIQRENLSLRNDVGIWKSLHERATKKIEKLQAENEQLRGEIRQLQGRLYGQKSEHASKRDRSNYLPGEELDDNGQPPVPLPRGQQASSAGSVINSSTTGK